MEDEMAVESRIQKWGNSQGVRFPKHLLEEVGLKVGDHVEIRVSDLEIVVKPARRRRRHRIEDLARLMPPDYEPAEEDWGNPEGREVW
jgi:antitoxin MazE